MQAYTKQTALRIHGTFNRSLKPLLCIQIPLGIQSFLNGSNVIWIKVCFANNARWNCE